MPQDLHEVVAAAIRASDAEPGPIREIAGQGAVNYVFVCNTSHGEWVIRIPLDSVADDVYANEEWSIRTAQAAGIPVAGFIARGTFDGTPYMIQPFVEGVSGDTRRSPQLWRELGRYERLLADVDPSTAPRGMFPRFGTDLRQNWEAHIDYNLESLSPNDPLIALGAYRLDQQDTLRSRFQRLQTSISTFGVYHGDLVPRNVIVREDGTAIVLDWGSTATGPTPHTGLLRILYGSPEEAFTEQDAAEFAAGYGVELEELRESLHDLWLLGKIDLVRWARDRRPDLVASKAAEAAEAMASWT